MTQDLVLELGHNLIATTFEGKQVWLVNSGFASSFITVEFETKWYRLWMVTRVGDEFACTPLSFDVLEPYAASIQESAFNDHVPNPRCVEMLAEQTAFGFDSLAEELITGRWVIERGGL